MTPQLTPDELKTLQLFTYYCRSHGANDVFTTFYLSDCSKDWNDDRWYSNDVSSSIESYDRIDELIEKLVDNDSIINQFDNCDGSQRIEVEIDCKERILNIYAYETVYGSEPHGSTYDLEDIKSEYTEEEYNAVVELFERLNGANATVDFSGGGDEGYIEDDMMIGGERYDIPKPIEELMYSMISREHAGWENNEGAQGSWEFNSSDQTIFFDFNYNTEEEVIVDLDYTIKF